ncbi:MAG: hypothetical protein KAZ63_00200 [Vitreoscilla sp.]|jgi:hypothetical protein|nr:hypothetical protein [Vitreoscilla sp.]
MKDTAVLLTHIRVSVIACATALLIAMALVVGLASLQSKLSSDLQSARRALGTLTEERDRLQLRERELTDGRERFQLQTRQGLIGAGHRDRWAQSLITAYQARGFQGVPDFKLAKPVPYVPPLAKPGATTTEPPSADQAGAAVHVHELEFEITQAHEGDVLAILAGLQRDHPGQQQPAGCELANPQPDGLKAICKVRFFNVSPVAGSAIMAARH